jgi:hypothetical protein
MGWTPKEAAVIPLGKALLPSSSNLPGSRTERAAPPPLFGLAPHGVCPARRIAPSAVRSYRTFSPLPKTELAPHLRRYIFCGTFREIRFERTPPAVSRHAALWRPDFPPANRFPDPRATTRTTGPTQLSQKARVRWRLSFRCQRGKSSRPSARAPRSVYKASRNCRRFRNRLTILAHSTKVEIDCALDKFTDFFLGFSGCNTAWQIGHVCTPGRGPLFVDDQILHQLLLHHQQQQFSCPGPIAAEYS